MVMKQSLTTLFAASTLVLLLIGISAKPLAAACNLPVFINEFHYDNVSTDSNEFVEIAGPAGSDLTGWSVVLYNGTNGATYSTIALSGSIDDEENSYGARSFLTPNNQNGSPDGLALVDNLGSMRQFLSYEGVFTATNGPANGQTSTDVGVVEDNTTPVGASLQLIGNGTCADEFTWSGPGSASPGTANYNQHFTTAPGVLSTNPAPNSLNVPVTAILTVTFSEPINAANAVLIHCSASGLQTVNPVAVVNTLTLPHADFVGGEHCIVTIPATSVVDLEMPANQLLADYTWSFEVGYPAADHATLLISDEELSNRALVDAQDDAWRTLVQTSSSCSQFQIGLLNQTPNTLCGLNTGDCINASTFSAGLVISYTLRNMDGLPLGSADAWASGEAAGCGSSSAELQDGAPRPTGLDGCYYTDGEGFRGSDNSPNGVLFTFSEPVSAFGAWFGDLETKSPGTNYYHGGADGGNGAGGASAYVRLFFDDGSMQAAPILPTSAPTGPWPVIASPPATASLVNGGDVSFCGGVDDVSDADGCGNESTRWVGFVADDSRRVKQMLVVVGDDDHSGAGPSDGPNVTCSGGDAKTCNGGTEYLSFIGPTVCTLPDLALAKHATPAVIRAGELVTYTLTYSNVIPGIATGPLTLADQLPAGMNYVTTLAANPPATLLDTTPRWQVNTLSANVTGYITFTALVDNSLAGLITNTAILTTPGELVTANNTARATTFVAAPGLVLRKQTNGQPAATPPGPEVAAGAPVTWTYQFSNTGNVPLTHLELVDDQIPTLTCAEGPLPALLPPATTFICTITGVAQVGQYTNTVTITATPTLGPTAPVTASASSHYFGVGYGNLIIVKQTEPDDPQDFTFTTNFAGGFALDDDADGTLANTAQFAQLRVGQLYTITEMPLTGWKFSQLDCTGATDSVFTIVSNTATVALAPGETVICTFTSTPVLTTLTVYKVVINDNGGTAMVADFPLFVNGLLVTSGVTNTLTPGVYTVTEASLAGYTGTFGGDCSAEGVVTLDLGAQKTCILTNNDTPSSLAVLTVHKLVVNSDAGTAEATDFPLFVNNQPVSNGVDNLLTPGTYTVSEINLPGYAATFSGDCTADGSIQLAAGEHKSCTITNDDVAPTLTVYTVVINDDGGAASSEDFPLFVDRQPVTSGVTNTFAAGVHTVSETNLPRYAATFSGDCLLDGTIQLNLGDRKVCTLTNNDIPLQIARVKVQKVVINDDGGTASMSDFPLYVNGQPVTNGVDNILIPGTYLVSAANLPGYTASFSGDCGQDGLVQLVAGEAKLCTIKSDDVAPSLTVHKVVINDNSGAATIGDFALFVDQQPVYSGAANQFTAGTYIVRELNLPGYATMFSGDCAADGTITLSLGAVKSCTITNNDLPPTLAILKVQKVVINDDGGTATVSNFPLFVNGQPVVSGADNLWAPGSYTVSEINLAGYATIFSGACTSDGVVILAAGESKTCTLTSDDIAPSLRIDKVVINHNGGIAVASDFPLLVDHQRVTSGVTNTLTAGTHQVAENNLLPYAAHITGDCAADGTVTLQIGEVKRCTITNDDLPPSQAILTVRQIVINDNGGTATVTDFPLFVNEQLIVSGLDMVLPPGQYIVSESNLPGYAATFGGDCAPNGVVNLAATDHHTCIVINHDIAPQFTVHKVVINNDGGEATVGDFLLLIGHQTMLSGITTSLSVGTYVIGEANLPGYAATISGDCAADGTVMLSLGDVKTCTIVNDDQFASLGDRVWYDYNRDGLQTQNEPGSTDVTVNLYDLHGNLLASTHTGPDGSYGFTRLAPGDYSVEFSRPAGSLFTQANAGSDPASNSDADSATGRTQVITLGPSEHQLSIDAGLLQLAELRGFVWNDLNANGRQDLHERGIDGISVLLFDLQGTLIATTTTSAAGYYTLTKLMHSDYSVQFIAPMAYPFSSPDQAADSEDSDVDPASGRAAPITLWPNTPNPSIDAGVLAYPLLRLQKQVSRGEIEPSIVASTGLTYTLTYSNVGLIDATGVMITERLPPKTVFNPAASSPGWQCMNDSAGALCVYIVENLSSGAQGTIIFAVSLVEAMAQPTEITSIAWIADDGTNTAMGVGAPAAEARAITRILAPTALDEADEPLQVNYRLYLPWITQSQP
jgi:uncharacterized repeat protein (TIGR01451 family)